METIKIQSGETIAMEVLKIKTIPHISIIPSAQDTSELSVVADYARGMSTLLTEIYQLYKDGMIKNGVAQDVALEILWVTEPVENQPYKASINLYLIVRAIANDVMDAGRMVSSVIQSVIVAAKADKFDVETCLFDHYSTVFSKSVSPKACALVREERVDNLQNQFFPYCYAYDRFPIDYPELSRITGLLIQHPYTAVSFQLIPTYFNSEELGEVAKVVQSVSMLSRGMSEQNIGSVSITAADRLSDLYRYYSDNKNRPLFLYNMVVFADGESLPGISTRILGQLNGISQPAPAMRFIDIESDKFASDSNQYFSMPWVVGEIVMNTDRNRNIWNSNVVSSASYRLPYIVTAEEAVLFFRLPISTDNVYAGLVVNESVRNSRTYRRNIINAGDIEVGLLKSAGDSSIGLSLGDLAKHMLVVGTPGSGKTTFSVGLLDRLWKQHHIPFLV